VKIINLIVNLAYKMLSTFFSVLSMIFYGIVYFPQIYTIIKLKSSEGISKIMVMTWTLADAINLIAVLILNLESSLVIIGWYHMSMTLILFVICLYYIKIKVNDNNDPELQSGNTALILNNFDKYLFLYGSMILISGVVISLIIVQVNLIKFQELISLGEIFGWLSISMFLLAKFPQIYKNYVSKSTHGLSKYMFIISISANISYLLTILTVSLENAYIIKNLPWISFSASSTLIDFVILFQFNYYKSK
jgi:solute carrier family 66 (lysosomal lysine-arginine transporter), member 1